MTIPGSIVFVVDDDESVRRSLERLLRVTGHRVESFSSAAAFLGRPNSEVPACLLLDIRMPQLNGLDVQRKVNEAGRFLPVIFMTGYADIESCVLGMKAGAADFLLKPCNEDQLLEAVDRALAQSARVYALIAEKRAIEDQLSSLTPRETEVFWLVVRGLLNKQIAGRLGTKEGTVKLHRANVMRKLDAQSVADLVRLADRLAQDSATVEDPSPNGSIPAAEYARIAAGSR